MCEQFIDKQLSLIQLERQAEIDEEKKIKSSSSLRQLQKSGFALTRLVVSERKTGLLGRTMVYLRPIGSSDELPNSNFSNGQIVAIYQTNDITADPEATGVIQRISKREIFLALDKSDVDLNENAPTSIVMWTSDVTYKRLRIAAEKLKDHLQKRNQMVELLLENGEPAPPNQNLPPPCRSSNGKLLLLNDQLDDSQKGAVDFALRQKDLAVIHGPPGTGKTTTIIEIICQAVKSGAKILACAPSNVAVDNIVERLAKRKIRVVRLGHTARSEQTLQKYSLDAILDSSDSHKIIRDVRSDINQAIKDIKGGRRGAGENIKSLRKELERRETAALRDVLASADVVLSTLSSAHDHGPLRNVPEEFFDYVVIDECSQATELSCWIALPRAKKVILAGDPWQLPPTVISPKAAKQGLALSLMERVIKKFGDKVTRMLTVQYRMHNDIMKWSSEAMYKGRLTAHLSVKEHLLKDLSGVDDTEDTSPNHWYSLAKMDLEKAERVIRNTNKAKNIIIFIGDGMGMSTVTAARIYQGQKDGRRGEEGYLHFEKFPHVSLVKTYNVDRQVPDSGATATAFFSGIKANFYTLGMNSLAKFNTCDVEIGKTAHVQSVLQWAQDSGRDTGFVTTTRITHATPAALYASTPNRDWESDMDIPEPEREKRFCKDIARQMIENSPGRNTKIILGGGLGKFRNIGNKTSRLDDKDLIQEWKDDKYQRGTSYRFIENRDQLSDPTLLDNEYILGCPLVLIDTAGADLSELAQEDDERSRSNPGEAKIVAEHVARLISAGVPAKDVAVVTPYNLQVETIRNILTSDYPEVEVRSVDGYQGREKEAIVMSMVRSNDDRSVGFLAEERRLNVAVTRARRHFCVICDVETVGSNKFIKGLIDHITNIGEVRSAFEYETSLPSS